MAADTKYFIYLRKSTDRDDMQTLSIESQRDELTEFVKRLDLNVVGEFEDRRSAKRPGRPEFSEMLRRIERGEANGIVAWAPDRLSRNARDGGTIIDMLDTETLTDLKFPTFWFENTAQGRQMLANAFIQSKYYVDDLSQNTKRGLRKKVRLGICPTFAPVGYLNDLKTKQWVVDETRRGAIVSLFELHATGESTLEQDRAYLDSIGFKMRPTKKNPDGRPISRTEVAMILHEPAYYGHFMYCGELHEGKHQPIISKTLYDRVQEVFAQHWPSLPKQRRDKPYLGLLKCAECGGAITAEVQKGHVYYRCTKKSKNVRCSQPFLRGEDLDAEVASVIAPYGLTAEAGADMLARLDQEEGASKATRKATIERLQNAAAQVTRSINMLLDMVLSGEISRDIFTGKKATLLSEKRLLEEQIAAVSKGRIPWLEPMRNWVFTALQVGETATVGTPNQRRALASEIFGSNLVLDRKKARGEAVNPWSLIRATSRGDTLVPSAGIEPTSSP